MHITDPVVLTLPHGGVPVAAEIAKVLAPVEGTR
jgi:predicted phosphoribosyltransferase